MTIHTDYIHHESNESHQIIQLKFHLTVAAKASIEQQYTTMFSKVWLHNSKKMEPT